MTNDTHATFRGGTPCSASQDLDHEIAELEKALAELRADQQRLDETEANLSKVGYAVCPPSN